MTMRRRQSLAATRQAVLDVQQVRARREYLIGVLCGLTVITLFSSFTLVSRMGFASSLKAIDIAALRFATAGAIMLPILLRHGLSGVRGRDAALLVVFGGLGFALAAYTGFALAPASHGAVLIHGALPLFSFLIGWLTGARGTGGQRKLGLAGIAVGIAAMAWDSLSQTSGIQWIGDGFLVLASVLWSSYGLLVRRLGLAPSHSGSIIAVFSAICYLPVYYFLPDKAIFAAPWQELVRQAIVQGALVGALGIFVYGRAVASLGAVGTAIFAAAVPCVTTVGAYLLLGEQPSYLAIAGVLIVTVGMAVSIKE